MKYITLYIILFTSVVLPKVTLSNGLLGGNITWVCNGSNYTFNLTVYRDCSTGSVTTSNVYIKIFNYAGLDSFIVNLISTNEVSPACTPVVSSPTPLSCSGSSIGSIQVLNFQSNPINLVGVPPAQGWVFAYSNTNLSPTITNLSSTTQGITIRSVMYAYSGFNTNPCFDNSPRYNSYPHVIICNGSSYSFNYGIYDQENDSLVFEKASSLVELSTPPVFTGTNPATSNYATNYSFTDATPSALINSQNTPLSINSTTGEINFKSFTNGAYLICIKATAYKCKVKVAEIYFNITAIVVACTGINAPPSVVAPFNGNTSFETTIIAGQLLNFNLDINDSDLLQDGSAQTITIEPVGNQFGASFTNAATGCTFPPCATLTGALSGLGNLSLNFNWQTSCAHVTTPNCSPFSTTYLFVFKISDNYCAIPGVTYVTIKVTVLNPIIEASNLKCTNVLPNGDVLITWQNPVSSGTFNRYEIIDVTGVPVVINTLFVQNTNSFTHIGANANVLSKKYIVKTYSGCSGLYVTISDTIATMLLNLVNPGDGRALLSWNKLYQPNSLSSTGVYDISLEYPTGTWNLIGSTNYGTEFFSDTVSICQAFLNYQISTIDNFGCQSTSTIKGANFIDLTQPYVPVISWVSVDTITNNATLTWQANYSEDTYGYIILQNFGGFWIIIDTVYGRLNTFYNNINSTANIDFESYGVAAFDSCFNSMSGSPNTSAMGDPHTTICLKRVVNLCNKSIQLNWNAYDGWAQGISGYDVFVSINNAPYVLLTSLPNSTTTFTHLNLTTATTYRYFIKANKNASSINSLSNVIAVFISQPTAPLFGYIQTASVTNTDEITIRYLADINASIHRIILQQSLDGISFSNVQTIIATGASQYTFIDNAPSSTQSIFYRVLTEDSCGTISHISNTAKTVFLTVLKNETLLENNLQWTNYSQWQGILFENTLLKSNDENESGNSIATLPVGVITYTDAITNVVDNGTYCYQIEAKEAGNPSGINATALSNKVCVYYEPILYAPNSFTPNGDGLNDEFSIKLGLIDISSYRLSIFNRYAHEIFTTTDIQTGWNGEFKGKMCASEVYIYQIQLVTASGQERIIKGHVTLLR